METKLAQYKKELTQRQIGLSVGILVTCVALALLNYFFKGTGSHGSDFIRGFQCGIFLGLELLMVYAASKIMSALKKEDRLKAMYIEEHDERFQSIRLHTFATSGLVSLGALAFAAVVAGFFDEKVCLTLIVTLVALALLKLPFKLYYAKKF